MIGFLLLVMILLLVVAAFLTWIYPYIVEDAEACAYKEPSPSAHEPLPKFTCAACGTGPWAGEWFPKKTTKGQQLCPNCTGAD